MHYQLCEDWRILTKLQYVTKLHIFIKLTWIELYISLKILRVILKETFAHGTK